MRILIFTVFIGIVNEANSQCLSAANPVGGTGNLLTLEKKTARINAFYKFNYGNEYFEGNQKSSFKLINNANYNYSGVIFGYGVTSKFTIESELGYFINKSQHYNLNPSYKLVGRGFSNFIVSGKYGIYTNYDKRIFYSINLGAKIPSSTKPKFYNKVELPIEVRSSAGAFGFVVQSFLVKENSGKGLRFFLTNRAEINRPNPEGYQIGHSLFTSLYISKHIMYYKVKKDWTAIVQLRNELRKKNTRENINIGSSGSNLFFISPQLNFYLKEKLNISVIGDMPLYQYFNGIQLATRFGVSISISGDF